MYPDLTFDFPVRAACPEGLGADPSPNLSRQMLQRGEPQRQSPTVGKPSWSLRSATHWLPEAGRGLKSLLFPTWLRIFCPFPTREGVGVRFRRTHVK
jgi:hypothetical protein